MSQTIGRAAIIASLSAETVLSIIPSALSESRPTAHGYHRRARIEFLVWTMPIQKQGHARALVLAYTYGYSPILVPGA